MAPWSALGMSWAMAMALARLLLALWLALAAAGGLEVEMAGRRQTVSLNKNITIICKVPGAPNLDIRTMGIRWFWKNQTSDLEKVFEFIGDHQEAIRPGATVSLWRLKRGDASLQLPAIQLREAGEYRCVVVVTPQKAEGRVWLEVIASPDSKLFWEQPTVNNKEEKHAVCKSSGFYPPNISIRWKKWIQKSAQYQEISENIFTERPVKNEDGTFNITSYLKLKLPVEDTGATYQCVIWHKSWPTSQKLNLTLPRGESEKTPYLLYLWILSIPVVGLILLPLYFVWKGRYRDRWTSGNETY
ncbi:natural cytotoxicity triggering receptor 3 ligand 1-like isoform X3 [Castor canadensis]|uniref:Natural cytotoxicity triggering receptor 3 ligand 1-like isoform X3 n=1 Tax=Castor canadensis TaxID=51338 RepID=A0AC58K106_CASCN